MTVGLAGALLAAVAYGVATILQALAVRRMAALPSPTPVTTRLKAGWPYAVGLALLNVRAAVIAFAVHAPLSELVQHFLLPGRSGDPWDAVLDLVGVGVGAVALLVRARRARW